MGRLPAEIDVASLLEQMDSEIPQAEMAKTLGVSLPTLRNKIDALRVESPLILEAKSVENLRVIRIKTKLLDKIENNMNNYEPDEAIRALTAINKMDKSEDKGDSVKGLLGLLTAIDDEAERRADEKVEEKLLEEKTVDVSAAITKNTLPNL